MPFFVIGTMSGTSYDGVDAAAVTTDGKGHIVLHDGPWRHYRRYSPCERQAISEAVIAPRCEEVATRAGKVVTQAHIECLRTLLSRAGSHSPPSGIVVGFHGQTILHEPEQGVTRQVGDGQVIADALGCTVVGDFRRQDIQNGGQGAPLSPIGHLLLTKASRLNERVPVGILNIGGVSNITVVPTNGDPEDLIACDVGPGGALCDDFVRRMSRAGSRAYDEYGLCARRGTVLTCALEVLKEDPFFKKRGPKSLDRNHFQAASEGLFRDEKLEDILATLVAFTVWSIKDYLAGLPSYLLPRLLVIAGGGGHNTFLVEKISQALEPDVQLTTAHRLGWSQDFLEAQIFAILAARTLLGLPSSFPNTTGVARPTVCGTIWTAK